MALDKLVDSAQLDADLELVADAIREKGGTSEALLFPDEYITAIAAIQTGGGGGMTVVETTDEHGGTIVTITGEEVTLQAKSATPTTSSQTIQPDSGYTGLSSVTVGAIPSQYIVPTGTKSITENGTGIDVAQYASVNVNVATPSTEPVLQDKTVSITPSETAQSQTVSADSGYDGLDEVTVNVGAISSTYVGSGITQRSSSDLTESGATVSVPAGYYSSASSKSVSSGTEGTPAAVKGSVSNHSISVTPSVTNTAGYIAGGTHNGTAVSVSASELVSGTKTITENGTGIDVTEYASVDVNVAGSAAPVLQSKTVNITPSGTAQSQTVTADSGYDGLDEVTVNVGATGPYVTYYTGSTAPSSSLGSDGDIYLQTS